MSSLCAVISSLRNRASGGMPDRHAARALCESADDREGAAPYFPIALSQAVWVQAASPGSLVMTGSLLLDNSTCTVRV